jgi:8-oxo-dGTP diphosphatase
VKKFNVRVYGLWINDQNEILVSDEQMDEFRFTKFPGGGLEFGEGIKDCLIREWKEELDLDIEILEHFYTTDFFQKSAFDDSQIISIYYKVRPKAFSESLPTMGTTDFENTSSHSHTFRWIPLQQISEASVSLPIDKKVVLLLQS